MEKKVNELTDLEIAIALQNQYQQINQCQQAIVQLNNELQKRLKEQKQQEVEDAT